MRYLLSTILLILSLLVLAQSQPVKQSGRAVPSKSVTPKKTELKKKEPKLTDLGIGIGVTRSVIFLSRNIKEFNDATGFCATLVYGGHKLLRVSAAYSQYSSINIEPTWLNIKARCYEANLQILARFRNNASLIYPITGISVNEFNGFFTGVEDFQNLREKYAINSQVRSYWIGANFGLGYEHKFNPITIFLAYKMRVGTQDANQKVNIMDVCYHGGIRYDIKVLTPKYLFRNIFRGYRSRYPLNVD